MLTALCASRICPSGSIRASAASSRADADCAAEERPPCPLGAAGGTGDLGTGGMAAGFDGGLAAGGRVGDGAGGDAGPAGALLAGMGDAGVVLRGGIGGTGAALVPGSGEIGPAGLISNGSVGAFAG